MVAIVKGANTPIQSDSGAINLSDSAFAGSESTLRDATQQGRGTLISQRLGQEVTLNVTFYSREDFPGLPARPEYAGTTLDKYMAYGGGPVQCAVDPSFIPLGTKFTIEINGKKIPCIAADTGSAITGNHVDVYVEKTEGAFQRGRNSQARGWVP